MKFYDNSASKEDLSKKMSLFMDLIVILKKI